MAKDSTMFAEGIPPLGLAYIAGALEKEGYPYHVVDMLGEGLDKHYSIEEFNSIYTGLTVDELISRIHPETSVLAFSVMFTNEWLVHEKIIRKVRDRFPNLKIILGGEHATAAWESILTRNPDLDFCILGEGEETLIELLQCLDQRSENYDQVSGLAFHRNDQIIKTPRRLRIKDINELSPQWAKFPVSPFLDHKSGMNTIIYRAMPISASRGCPYQCTFCSSPTMWGTQYVMRKPQLIVEEMKWLKKTYNVEHFDFTDLSATINKKWVNQLTDEILEANLGVSWQFGPGTRSEVLTYDVLRKMKDAGLFRITFAPESGSNETIQKIKKRINLKKLEESIQSAIILGLQTKCQFIMGFPDQTNREYIQSSLYILKLALLGVDDIAIFSFFPYPGSELANQLAANHFSNEDYSQMFNTRVIGNKSSQIGQVQVPAWKIFFFTTFLMFLCYCISFLRKPSKVPKLLYRVFISREPRTTLEIFLYVSLIKAPPSVTPLKLPPEIGVDESK